MTLQILAELWPLICLITAGMAGIAAFVVFIKSRGARGFHLGGTILEEVGTVGFRDTRGVKSQIRILLIARSRCNEIDIGLEVERRSLLGINIQPLCLTVSNAQSMVELLERAFELEGQS